MEIIVKSPFCWLFFSLLPTPAGASGRWQASFRFPGWVSRGVAEGCHIGWRAMWATGWGVRAGGVEARLGARPEGQDLEANAKTRAGALKPRRTGGISGHTAMRDHSVSWE